LNTTRSKRPVENASVLLITLFAAGVLGITLASYLLMLRAEAVSVARSQAWNSALPLANAGIEEGLAKLNDGYLNSILPLNCSWSCQMDTNNYYSVTVTATNNGAYLIASTGSVRVPAIATTITRTVQILAKLRAPFYWIALAANSDIALAYSGQFATTITTPRHTNDGLASLRGNVDLAYRTVDGDVWLGPEARFDPTTDITKISTPAHTNYMAELGDVTLPPTGGCFQSTGTTDIKIGTNTVHYDYAFLAGNAAYYLNSINGSIYVGTNAHVTIITPNNATVKKLYIAGSTVNAGSLTLYVAGGNFSLTDKATVENQSATNFSYFGSPSNTNVNLNLGDGVHGPITTNFFGTIYAPAANVTITDDYGNSPPYASYAFTGSVSARTITQIGKVQFHFDDNLLNTGPQRRYVVASWQEL
jgi:hypothetical protein